MNEKKHISIAVVGSRGFNDYDFLKKSINKIIKDKYIKQFISGGAKGADKLAEKYALENKYPIKLITPDWRKGNQAGLERNTKIIEQSDIVIAFWDGISKGTHNTINKTKEMNKLLYLFRY